MSTATRSASKMSFPVTQTSRGKLFSPGWQLSRHRTEPFLYRKLTCCNLFCSLSNTRRTIQESGFWGTGVMRDDDLAAPEQTGIKRIGSWAEENNRRRHHHQKEERQPGIKYCGGG